MNVKTHKVSENDYNDAVESHMGFCISCQDFTRDSTEPDAESYGCPECEKNSVMGAENALICGFIEFSNE